MTALTMSGFDGVLSAAQEGSEWAWDILVRDTAPRLVGFFRTRGVPDPEDLAGMVFLDLAGNLRSFTGDESEFRSWVYAIAYQRMSDEWREQQSRPSDAPSVVTPRPVETSSGPEDITIESVGEVETLQMLEALTADQRDVVTLRVVADLTLDETAKAVGKPAGAVKALQRTGLSALKREIGQGGASQ